MPVVLQHTVPPYQPSRDIELSSMAISRVRGLREASVDASAGSTLEVAVRSVLESHGPGAGLSSVVAERALRHCAEGLRQYLTIRLEPDAAHSALADLERAVLEPDTLSLAPGPRARLYAHARAALASTAPRISPDDPAWWSPSDATARYRAHLAELRGALDAASFEIAELTYARRLRIDELAFVVGRDISEVEETLARVDAQARALFGAEPPSRAGTLEDALLEAFALRADRPLPFVRPALLTLGDVVASRYRVEELLGAGAFADVYRAADLEVPDHVVALKLFRLPATNEGGAVRELRLIASVSHPSVVQFKDHGWHDGRIFFVMPFYRGETLRQRLGRGPLGRVEAHAIFVPLARALAALHRNGVRHQDIKPENIFLARPNGDDEELLPVLLDLGVAAKDAENVLAGTPNYFAPEVAARFAREPDPPLVTGKSDVFSLALALRNALTAGDDEEVAGGAVDAFVRYRARHAPKAPEGAGLSYLKSSFERWLHLAPDRRPDAEQLIRELGILTLPEERRARFLATVRWVAPIVVTLAAVFGTAVFTLSREADVQRIEAARAREQFREERDRAVRAVQRVERAQEDLAQALETRRSLEANVARLEQDYRSSRLTRQELAAKLARAEGDLAVLNADYEARARRHAAEQRRLGEHRDTLQTELNTAKAELSTQRERVAQVEADASRLRTELEAATTSTADARARVDELEQAINALRTSLEPAAPAAPPGPPAPSPSAEGGGA